MGTDELGPERERPDLPCVRIVDGSSSDHLEIELREQLPAGSPSPGDVRLRVAVGFRGFSGEYHKVWIHDGDWRTFLGALRQIERTRHGSATVAAMSPNEFELRIYVTNGRGHISAEGFLGRHHWSSSGDRLISRISFVLEIDPSRMRDVVDAFDA